MNENEYREWLNLVALPVLNGMSAAAQERERCNEMTDVQLAREWRVAYQRCDGLLMRVIEEIQEDRNRRA